MEITFTDSHINSARNSNLLNIVRLVANLASSRVGQGIDNQKLQYLIYSV